MRATTQSLVLCFCISLFMAGAVGHCFAQSGEIGHVIALTGQVVAEQGGQSRNLSLKDPVFVQDLLKTGSDGKAQIIFNDDSTLNIGNNSVLEMQDFASEGAKPRFKAHLGEGVARIITGRIVEKNPEGFAFSTPDATVGIRGTIIGFRVQRGQNTSTGTVTEVVLLNSMGKTVTGNGREIPEGNMAVFAGGRFLREMPITPEYGRQLGYDVIIGTGPSAPAGQDRVELAATRLPETGALSDLNTAFSATQSVADSLVGSLADSLVNNPTTALVDGDLTSVNGSGTFQFSVDLASGNAFDATMGGDFTPVGFGLITYSATGGSGGLNQGSYLIEFLPANVTVDNTPGGFASLVNIHGQVPSLGSTWSGEYSVSGGQYNDNGNASAPVKAAP